MKIQRILAIVMLLLGRESVSAKELAKQFEVSLRTIYRDVEAINAAGVPIWSRPGVGGGIGIMQEYKVEKRIFTIEDILALLTALGFVSGAVPAGEIAPALAKIQSLLPGGTLPVQNGRLVFDPSAWMGVDVSGLVAGLHRVIGECRCVQFSYIGQRRGEGRRTVEPYRLIFKQNSWYLQGWCLDRSDMRLFKLARMWDIVYLEQRFAPRSLPPVPDSYTRHMEHKAVIIRLRVKPTILDRMLELVKAEQLEPTPDGCYEVGFPFVPDDFGYGLILSLGTGCECLSPGWVRKELAMRLDVLRETYR